MGLENGFAGFAYILGDFVATNAFGCALWIAGASFINLGSDRTIDAPVNAYVAWLLSVVLGISGQVAIKTTNLHQPVSGIFGLSHDYPIITIGCAIGLFMISRFVRKDKYR